jgi:hypothetical protein
VDKFDSFQITKEQLLEKRGRLDATKASGLDSTSNALLKILLAADDHISEELLVATNRCLRGELTDVERAIHSNARGVGAGKHKSTSLMDVRPLGCTNAFARLVARCLLALIMDALNDYFLNSSDRCKQFAFCRGGTELNYAAVCAHLELNPDDACISTDKKAAFNLFDRQPMFDQLERVPGLRGAIPYVATVYGRPAVVHVDRGVEFGPLEVLSYAGAKQGCGLAMAMYCLTQFPSMLEATERHPDTACFAFADDAKTLGPITEALDAAKTYITDYSLRTRGETNMAKSEIYAPGKSEGEVRASLESAGFSDLPIALEGTVVTGGPIGSDDFVANFVKEQVKKKSEVFPLLLNFENVQNQFLYLSQGLCPSFVHLARLIDCSPGTVAGAELAKWDASLKDILSQVVSQPLDDRTLKLASLPKCKGGLGLSFTADIAAPAHVASKLLAAQEISNMCPQLASAFDGLRDPEMLSHQTERTVADLIDRMTYESEGIGVIIDKYGGLDKPLKRSHRLQAKLSSCLHDIKLADLQPGLSLRDKAQLNSSAGDVHSLSCAAHRSSLTTFSNPEIITLIARRLLIKIEPFTGQQGGLRCDGCGKSGCEQGFGDSRLSCNSLPHVTKFIHDPLKELVGSLARSAGLRAKVEPSSVAQTDARRTDVKISGLLGNQGELFTDITVTNPTCASHVEDAAVVAGSAAAKAAVAKMGYHGAAVASTGPDALFVPFAAETGGRVDMSAEALIDALVRASSKDRRAWGPVKTYWMRALAVTIHKGVHKVIARPRLPQPRLFLPSNGNSSGNSGPPSAASLSRLAHITTPNDRTNDHLNLEPADVQDPFHISRSSQPSAALVGGARTRA